MADPAPKDAVQNAQPHLRHLQKAMQAVIKGKPAVIDHVLTCLLAGGHVLIEDLPGVGKTTLAYALARSVDCAFSRIQFTSDLLPSDVTGVSIYDESSQSFSFKPGPIFANIVLADEINRATPKTQSALLEVMDRAHVTVDGLSHPVGSPFMVFATQNPIDDEGTFPLPESQLDRFLMRLHMGYPSFEYEMQILRAAHHTYDDIAVETALPRDELRGLQALCQRIYVEDTVLDYILRLVAATRTNPDFRAGISVRGSLALRQAAQARALLNGRAFVIPQDVAELVPAVFVHRLILARPEPDSLSERRGVATRLETLLGSVPPPS